MKYLIFGFLAILFLACSPKASPESERNVVDDMKPNAKIRLHDIWALEAINGEEVDFRNAQPPAQHPTLELNLTEMRVFGNDGCNEFTGPLNSVTETELHLGPFAGTLKACGDLAIPGLVNSALAEVVGYELNGLKLSLKNEAGMAVLRYRKVD